MLREFVEPVWLAQTQRVGHPTNMRKFTNLQPGQTHTLATIQERTVEEGDCWLWQAGKSHGTPALRHDGRIVQVRRFIAEVLQGRTVPGGRMVSMTCDNLDCVNPAHIGIYTRKQLQQRTAARTQYGSDMARNLKIARIKQQASSLDWQKVREIRAMEGSIRQVARELGMNFDTVRLIRQGITWKEASPFAGLFTRLAANDGRRAA